MHQTRRLAYCVDIQAFILAQLDDNREVAERIRCLFFLATPHRGSDFAALLNRILKVSGVTGLTSSREYINDLKAGSTSSQIINEDFGKYAENLLIYSFYETLPTNLGVTSALVVDKSSAILGESRSFLLCLQAINRPPWYNYEIHC